MSAAPAASRQSDYEEDELVALQRRFDSARERFLRQERKREREERRELYQREMGLGYLIYVARQHRRLSQGRLARRMGTSTSVITRWESGGRLPSLLSMERLAAATDLELLVGLRDPHDRDDDLLALGIAFEEGNLTELLMLVDKNNDQLRVTPWRARLAQEDPSYEGLLR